MKKSIKGFVLGLIVATMLMSTVLGAGVQKTIDVVLNKVNITVNGNKVEGSNILYDGTTYVPLRDIAEMLGKEVGWDGDTNTASINDSMTAKVTRVVDGDTIVVDFNGKEERVRLIGVDTPESVHPDATKNVEYGKVASEFTKSKLEGKEVKLEIDIQERDRYGRLLAYVYLDGKMFNKTLLEEGYAQIATYPPNVKYVDVFTELEKIARDNDKGLWGIVDEEPKADIKEDVKDEDTQTQVKTEGTYVGSVDSDKYHNPTCRWAKKISADNQIWFDTIDEAHQAGYKACGVCSPK